MNAQNAETAVLEEQPHGHIFSINPWWSAFEERRLITKRAVVQAVAAADPERLRRLLDVFDMRTKRLEFELEALYGPEGFEVTVALIDRDSREIGTPAGPKELFWTEGRPFRVEKQILGIQDFIIERDELGWWAIKKNRYTRAGVTPKTLEKVGPLPSDIEAVRRLLQWRLEDIYRVGIWEGTSYEFLTEIPLQCRKIDEDGFGALLDAQYRYKVRLEPRLHTHSESAMAARTKVQLQAMIAVSPSLLDSLSLTLDQIVDLELLLCWYTLGYAMLPMDILAQRIFLKFDVNLTPKALEKRCRRLHLVSLRYAQPKIANTDLLLGVP